MRLTDAQRRYLIAVRDGKDTRVMTKRGFRDTVAGYHCRKMGLAEWVWEFDDGSVGVRAERGERSLRRPIRLILTEAGRRALEGD